MASGHVNRASRPNTWLHRPSCKREENPCQRGAVHTWHITSFRCTAPARQQLGVKRTCHGHGWIDAIDPNRTPAPIDSQREPPTIPRSALSGGADMVQRNVQRRLAAILAADV